MILTAILIALAVNGLIINPAYIWFITKLNLDRKPFNCVYCLGWWLGVIWLIAVAFTGTLTLFSVIVPLAASFLAVAFNRWFDSLPVRIK